MAERSVFEQALSLLKPAGADSPEGEEQARFPLHWLSDLSTDQARSLSHMWRGLPVDTRRDLMGRMDEEVRENFELDFTAIARFALEDEDAEVRRHAIGALWECEDVKLADRFLQIMEHDSEPVVRAVAAASLGAFVENAEFEEIPPEVGRRIQGRLFTVIRGPDVLEVRRSAVESIGYCSHPEVRSIVQAAYSHPEERMRVSALVAMGRTADPFWSHSVLEALQSSSSALRAAAARAAGELELRKSVPILIDLLEDAEREVRWNAIESLGEIGGLPARRALEKLQMHASEEESDWIDDALENAEFQESLSDLPLLDISGEDEEDEQE